MTPAPTCRGRHPAAFGSRQDAGVSDGHPDGVLPILGLRHEFRPHRQVAGPRECWSLTIRGPLTVTATPVLRAVRVAVPLQDPPESLGDQGDPWRHLLSDGSRGGAIPARPERWSDLDDGLADRAARICPHQ